MSKLIKMHRGDRAALVVDSAVPFWQQRGWAVPAEAEVEQADALGEGGAPDPSASATGEAPEPLAPSGLLDLGKPKGDVRPPADLRLEGGKPTVSEE